MNEKLDTLIAAHPFFKGLDKDYVSFIAECGRNVRLDVGELVLREGEVADSFYLVRSGRVALQIHIPGKGPVTVQTIEKGDILGWSWLFPPYETYFDARVTEDVRAVKFDGPCLRGKCEADPALGFELTKRFAQVIRVRLRATHLQLVSVYQVPSPWEHAKTEAPG